MRKWLLFVAMLGAAFVLVPWFVILVRIFIVAWCAAVFGGDVPTCTERWMP